MTPTIKETIEGMSQAGISAVKEGKMRIAIAAINNISGFRDAAMKHGKFTAEDEAIYDFNIFALEEAIGGTRP